ncbi:uncharacterized protein DEA37_0000666 [Paragonimus westermani]|uniref:Uncharacterized protein n=1 Tax=Paragonimus westermani TaxID=34504 RepID=A0A5J4NGH5_9TREM|nr:uncharacterized protein DEA37_0000666 [Paragonimus westermani]
MLQATASLIAGARVEDEQGRLLSYLNNRHNGSSAASGVPKRDYQRRFNYSLTARLRNRVCSDSCLKFIYLSCATLVSASFIIECILLHLIVFPYLSESVFEPGVCKFSAARREDDPKKCENKCSKERSTFPCLQLLVVFTPIKFTSPVLDTGHETLEQHSMKTTGKNAVAPVTDPFVGKESASLFKNRPASLQFATLWDMQQRYDIPPNARFNFSSPESRFVYLYDYFSTFAAHKTSKCSTSPCHRREEDNKNAVEDFKRVLWRRHLFLCYARPVKVLNTSEPNSLRWFQKTGASDGDSHSGNRNDDHESDRPIIQSSISVPKASKDAAAILYRLYTPSMFFHSLCWPGGIFLGALVVLLFTYLADGCQAWARDKTVIA